MTHRQQITNEAKLRQAFADTLNVPVQGIIDDLAYESTAGWDSVAHMALIAALDNTFDILIDSEDIIDISNFTTAREILQKYGVSFA